MKLLGIVMLNLVEHDDPRHFFNLSWRLSFPHFPAQECVLEGEESEFLWQKDPLVLIKTLGYQPYHKSLFLKLDVS